jgi:protein-disulfide isomerase
LIPEGQAKLVWHDMAFLGPESVQAAEAAKCATDQGRFWDYHDKLFAEQRAENSGAFSNDNLIRFATELGLDRDAFQTCLTSDKYRAEVLAERQAGMQQGVSSTPTLFVNGQKFEGVPSFDQLRRAVEAAQQ